MAHTINRATEALKSRARTADSAGVEVVFAKSTPGLGALILRLRQSGLHLTVAEGEPSALLAVQRQQPDAIIAEVNGSSDPLLRLLERARSDHGEVMRVAIAPADKLGEVSALGLAHRTLDRSEGVQEIVSCLETSRRFRELIRRREGRRLVGSLGRLPSLPWLYEELRKLRDSQSATADTVCALLNQDPVASAEIIRMASSMVGHRSRRGLDLQEAVVRLGLDAVMAAVLHAFHRHEAEDLADGFSLDDFQQHSAAVAQLAVSLDLHPRPAEVYVAGLLHNLGSLVLASRLPGPYARILRQGATSPIWDVERELLFASHQEIGAALLSLWGMPVPVVDCALGHHNPSMVQVEDPLLLAVIHTAVCLLEAPGALSRSFVEAQGVKIPEDLWADRVGQLPKATREAALARVQHQTAGRLSGASATPSQLSRECIAHEAAVWEAFAESLLGSNPGQYTLLAKAISLRDSLLPVLTRDQDIFGLGCLLLGVQYALAVNPLESAGFVEAVRAKSGPRLGTALGLSQEPYPSGRDSDQALHLVVKILDGLGRGLSLDVARDAALDAASYPWEVEEAVRELSDLEKVINLFDLQEGMTLAEDLRDPEGRLLASSGQTITGRTLRPLRRLCAQNQVRILAA